VIEFQKADSIKKESGKGNGYGGILQLTDEGEKILLRDLSLFDGTIDVVC
jgi:hypothetical protein